MRRASSRNAAQKATARKPAAKKAAGKKAAAASKTAKSTSPAPGMSLKEHAYQLIKHRIITCAFQPGEPLNEADVAQMLNLGRTPVNQAFDRLRLEALVDVMPRKGIIVRHIDFDEVLQISEARMLNEAYAIRLAAERATAAEMSAMRDVLAEAASLTNDLERFVMLDREFHLLIADAAKSAVFADILLNLNERSLRLWSISLADEAHKARVNAEHHNIFLAICRRDANDAERNMRTHIESFRQTIVRKLSEQSALKPLNGAEARRKSSRLLAR